MIKQDAIKAMIRELGYVPVYAIYMGNPSKVVALETYCPNCYADVKFENVEVEEIDHVNHMDTPLVKCYRCNTVLRITYDNSRGFRSSFFMIYEGGDEGKLTQQPEKYVKPGMHRA